MSLAIPILYLLGGAAIAFFAVLSLIEPDKFWGARGSVVVKRIASAFALLGGGVLMSQGFALIYSQGA